MDEELVAVLARAARLDKALAEFPEDVQAAAEQARTMMEAIPAQTSFAASPFDGNYTGTRTATSGLCGAPSQ